MIKPPAPPIVKRNNNGYLKVRNASFDTEIVTRELVESLIKRIEKLEEVREVDEDVL